MNGSIVMCNTEPVTHPKEIVSACDEGQVLKKKTHILVILLYSATILCPNFGITIHRSTNLVEVLVKLVKLVKCQK